MKDKYIGSGKLLKPAIKKYGKENFKNEIVEVVESLFQANVMEKVWIAKERALGKAEYNLSDGGGGSPGFHHTKEAIEKIRKAGMHPCKEETKTKISKKLKGIPFSDEHKQKLSEAKEGFIPKTCWKKGNIPWNVGKHYKNPKKCKKVIYKDMIFDSVKDAALYFGVSSGAIISRIKCGKQEIYYGQQD